MQAAVMILSGRLFSGEWGATDCRPEYFPGSRQFVLGENNQIGCAGIQVDAKLLLQSIAVLVGESCLGIV
jgi:hypothetical protein